MDIVVLPTGEIFQIDEDELEDALAKGIIDESLYKIARTKAEAINRLIDANGFHLLTLTKSHKSRLQESIEKEN